MIDLKVDSDYHRLRVEVLRLAARHLERLHEEKDAERARREELREQERPSWSWHGQRRSSRASVPCTRPPLEARLAHGDEEGAAGTREKIAEDDANLADVERRAAIMRAGTSTSSPPSASSARTWSRSA